MTEVHFINVGYGDAALIVEKASGKPVFSMLIDCGGDTAGTGDPTGSRIMAAEYLKSLGIESVDLVLLTHLHLDHAGGLLSVAENCAVKELWTPYVPPENSWGKDIRMEDNLSPEAGKLKKSLNLYAAALELLGAGNTVIHTISNNFGSSEVPSGPISVTVGERSLVRRQTEILDAVFGGKGTNDLLSELHGFINDTSLRTKLNLQGFIFLFTGDIDAAVWEKEGVTKADVVKLPHHAQPGSINEDIARRLASKYAVICVSNTRKDCPDPNIIEWVERAGSRVLITDAAAGAAGQQAGKRRAVRFQVDEGVLTLCEDG